MSKGAWRSYGQCASVLAVSEKGTRTGGWRGIARLFLHSTTASGRVQHRVRVEERPIPSLHSDRKEGKKVCNGNERQEFGIHLFTYKRSLRTCKLEVAIERGNLRQQFLGQYIYICTFLVLFGNESQRVCLMSNTGKSCVELSVSERVGAEIEHGAVESKSLTTIERDARAAVGLGFLDESVMYSNDAHKLHFPESSLGHIGVECQTAINTVTQVGSRGF